VVGIGAGALRLLLLALLSIGIIGMHTVGHSTDHHSWAASSANGASDVTGAGMVDSVAQQLTAMTETCDGDCGAHGPLTVWPGSDPVPGGAGLMIVCLAVLCGVGLWALVSHALARRAGPVPRGGPPGTTSLRQTGLGLVSRFPLRLVDVAVLRI
jgi:hypothetical protein